MILMEHKGQLLEGVLDQTEMENVISMSAPLSKPLPEDLFLILDIIDDFKSFFPSNMKSPLIPISVTLDWCTPKVKILVDILLGHYTRSSAFQGIIFVEQRQIASTLAKVLQVIPELSGKIKCAFIVGEGVNSDGVSKQTDRFHGNPLELFRKRSINIRTSNNFSFLEFLDLINLP
jgi:endoribonuclease Dicer